MPTVSGEGWGLYSEYLGFELGMFEEDKLSEFGFYSLNLLRACRLVVDTGLHAMDWSRDAAVDYMVENTPAARHVLEREVDRSGMEKQDFLLLLKMTIFYFFETFL